MFRQIHSFFQKYRHGWLLAYGFLYLPWFCYLEKTVTRDYHVIHVPMDDYIPFNEYFIVPYLMWFFYVAGAMMFFLFKSKDDFIRMCCFLFTGMTISLIVCTFFENGTDFRPFIDPEKNPFCAAVAILYKGDTCTNVFPSIHVYNSIGTHIAIAKSQCFRNHPWIRFFSGLLMISICLSTVFLKQHSVVDGIGSIIMAYVMYGVVYLPNWASQTKKGYSSTAC